MEKDIIKIKCLIIGGYISADALRRRWKAQPRTILPEYTEYMADVLVTEENVSSLHTSLHIGQTVQLGLLNIAGYDIDKIRRMGYENPDVVLMNADLSIPDSLSYLRTLLAVKKKLFPNTPFVVGGETDRLGGKYDASQCDNFVKETNASGHKLYSRTGEGVDDLFNLLIRTGVSRKKFHSQILDVSKDEKFLTILNSLDFAQFTNELLNGFYKNNGRNILHIMMEKSFFKASDYLLESRPELAVMMANQMDRDGRTPVIVANAELKRKLTVFMKENKVNFRYGVKQDTAEVELLESYTKFGCSALLEEVNAKLTMLKLAELEDQAVDFYNEFKKTLKRAPTKEDFCNEEDLENILHILARRDFGKCISAILNDVAKEHAYTMLSEKDENNFTPLMRAAVEASSKAMVPMLTFFLVDNDQKQIGEMLHDEDSSGHTLSYLINNATKTLMAPYGIVMQLERDFHVKNDDDNEGFMDLQVCIKKHHGSSQKTVSLIATFNEARSISCSKLSFQIIILILGSLLFPLSLWFGDVTTDCILAQVFYMAWQNQSLLLPHLTFSHDNLTLKSYPDFLPAQAKFYYSVAFIALPFVFYSIQVFRSLSTKSAPNVFHCLFKVALYPCFQMVRNFTYQLKFLQARGQERLELEKKARRTEIDQAFAHLLEVCLESSFQPLLQWYILFPSVFDTVVNLDYVELASFYSWFLSLLSLSWSFTAYNAALKNGALSVQTSPISRVLLFFSNMCLIFARMNCIIVFMYFWGPGQFYPGVVFILLHTLMIAIFHYYFSNVANMSKSKEIGCFKVIHACLINGLANIFSHNWVRKYEEDNLKDEKMSTFSRQLVFDGYFFVENIIMLTFGCMAGIQPLNDIKTMKLFVPAILIIHLFGVGLKVTYYRFFHIWSDLNGKKGKLYKCNHETRLTPLLRFEKQPDSAQADTQTQNDDKNEQLPLLTVETNMGGGGDDAHGDEYDQDHGGKEVHHEGGLQGGGGADTQGNIHADGDGVGTSWSGLKIF